MNNHDYAPDVTTASTVPIPSTTHVLEVKGVTKEYPDKNHSLSILRGIDLVVRAGASVAIMGASGAGKSTLLHILGGLDTPSTGQVEWLGHNIQAINEKERCRLRNEHLGFVYQFHHLLPEFNALENVAMPLIIGGSKAKVANDLAWNALAQVGMSARASHRPGELSGGERQRVALARALVGNPKCVLADEPTGNLDAENARIVYDLMHELQLKHNTAFVLVTHDVQLAQKQERLYVLENGYLGEQKG